MPTNSQQMAVVQSPGMVQSPQMINTFVQAAGRPLYGSSSPSRPLSQQQMNMHRGRVISTSFPPAGYPLIPRLGQRIERNDWPHSHHEKTSLLMSLHQAHVRSPDRAKRQGYENDERHYQAVRSFALPPVQAAFSHDWEFTISDEDFSLLSKDTRTPVAGREALLPIHEYTNGSLRYRLRCWQLKKAGSELTESEWVVMDMCWPQDIFVLCNEQPLTIRKAPQHGKDQPVELTGLVVAGTNKLRVVAPRLSEKKSPHFYLAVEVLETLSHSEILDRTWKQGLVSCDETLNKIQTQVNAIAREDEDTIAVTDRNGNVVSDLSIDMTDPFSSSIFTIPARGKTCTHMECFDLETWLNTRPRKQILKCQHRVSGGCDRDSEPSQVDKWRCPICYKDARPGSLLIDSFLHNVRLQLGKQNKLDTKSILVAADGNWRPVVEPVDDDAGSDGDTPAPFKRGPIAALQKKPSKSASVERTVEIIELD